jgi:hypothetical protein
MKSHTGGVVSLGRGVIMSKSSKQKLNTKSSMEAELVGASDYLPSTIWAKMFLKEQGYELRENTFYQDNQAECHEIGDKWMSVVWAKVKAHRHQIFLHEGSSQE